VAESYDQNSPTVLIVDDCLPCREISKTEETRKCSLVNLANL